MRPVHGCERALWHNHCFWSNTQAVYMKLSVYAHPCRHDICSANWSSGQLSWSVSLNTYSQYWASTVRQKNLTNECRMKCVRLKTNKLIEKNSGFAFKIFHTEWIKMVSYMNRRVILAFILEQRISMMSIKCSVTLKTSELQLPSRPAHLLCLFKYLCWKCRWRHFEFIFIYCINLVHHDNVVAAEREWR